MISLLSLLGLLASSIPCQDTQAGNPPVDSANVEGLRERIHDMRMNLLLGGDQVRKAENDATQFYRSKVETIEKRLDSVAAELAELRANYEVSLEHALQGGDAEQRKNTLSEAAEQRGKIQALEVEESDLTERRSRLERLVEAVESRTRQRERLAAQIESGPGFDEALAFPLGAIGLAPELEVLEAASPLEHEGLIADLIARDPVAAHRLLYEADPAGYWALFSLQPPADALRRTLKFPLADLPGQR